MKEKIKNLIGKKLYQLRCRSYEGDIKSGEKGVEGKLSYIGKIKDIKQDRIIFEDNNVEVFYRNLGGKTDKGYLFLDLEDFLKK